MRALPTAPVGCFWPLPWGRAVRRRSAWLEATAEEWRPIATREEFRLRAPRPAVKPIVMACRDGLLRTRRRRWHRRRMTGVSWLIGSLLYGAGLRLQECLELRVKDNDFERHQVVVRRGKGHKDRRTVLPATVKPRLIAHLADVKRQHERDLSDGVGRVVLPAALDRKYPNAGTDWVWQFVFPAGRICRDPRLGPPSRYRLHESVVQRAVTAAVRFAGIPKRASCQHIPPFICDAPAQGLLRHSNHSGAARPRGCQHDDDLYACSQPRCWASGARPTVCTALARFAAGSRT